MAKTGIGSETKIGADLAGEKSARFEKFLGLFQEKDQNFLINAPAGEFSDFLQGKGFPSDELLDARDSWLTHEGTAQGTPQQAQDEEKEGERGHKESHQPHQAHEAENTEEEGKPSKEETLADLKKRGFSDEEAEKLYKLKESYQGGKEPTTPKPLTQEEGGGLSHLKEKGFSDAETEKINKLRDAYRGIETPRDTPSASTAEQPRARRINMPSLGIQRRTIGGINRGARSMRRLSGAGRGAAKGLAKKIGKRAAVQGLRLLFTTPVGWIILAIIAVGVILLFFILFFFTGTPDEGKFPPVAPVQCSSVPGATCIDPAVATCPDGTVPSAPEVYTCSIDGTPSSQTCCVPKGAPGYFIPPFKCGNTYVGSTYLGHTAYAVDFNRYNRNTGKQIEDKYDPVRASADGVVIETIPDNGQVAIKHEGGYVTRYAHMIRPLRVSINQIVVTGQQIGQIDDTGASDGSHLHLGLYKNGSPVQISFYGTPYPVSVFSGSISSRDPIDGPCP